jgi:N utilization substance protein A
MAGSTEILNAIRELANLKQIERAELHEMLQDGINAALAKKHGPTVQAEVDIDEEDLPVVAVWQLPEELPTRLTSGIL